MHTITRYKHGFTLGIAGVALTLFFNAAKAEIVYGYSLGVSLTNQVIPGSLVNIGASLRNTGNQPIRFAPSLPGYNPDTAGGAIPFWGASFVEGWDTVTNINYPTYTFFEGRVIDPGDTVDFTYGSFTAPSDPTAGNFVVLHLNFGIQFIADIVGNLLGISNDSFDYSRFDNAPFVYYTFGDVASSSVRTFSDGLVVDSTGRIISGPIPGASAVPEPSTYASAGVLALLLTIAARRSRALHIG